MRYQWTVDTNKGKITGATLSLRWIVMIVHHYIHFDPNDWFVSCVQVGFNAQELKAKDLQLAMVEAFDMVRDRIREYDKAIQVDISCPIVSRIEDKLKREGSKKHARGSKDA